ncbi:hypothetical protein DSO57_1039759 [Entomophthora muscae]|uniref:Uncharacterized protein n=1 Tax=Entomophthora muscae TaxID=34485 RepID=A0ACC2UFP0_9FUNG|nr:hypothetical protein DSO57_1039759 [Entomophthora muscae]
MNHFFSSSLRSRYGWVKKRSKDSVEHCAAVCSQTYSIVVLLGPCGLDQYQMIKGSHNSGTFLDFLQAVKEYFQINYSDITNVVMLDNVRLYKVNLVVSEFFSMTKTATSSANALLIV